jgi:hypothetical protein
MFFDANSLLNVCVAILPNAKDDWAVTSPFPSELLTGSEEYFVLSNGQKGVGLSKGHYVSGKLVDISKFSNEINFLTKTSVNTKPTTSKGIGGFSKQKDLTITLTVDNDFGNEMSSQNIIDLYARKTVLYLVDNDTPFDLDHYRSLPVFKGRIQSAHRVNGSVSLVIRGMFESSNTIVKGNSTVDMQGNKVNSEIVLGESSDKYVKLTKFLDDNKRIKVGFPQSDKFIAKELFVKAKTNEDEDLYLPIISGYTLKDEEIVFDDYDAMPVNLHQDLSNAWSQVESIVPVEFKTTWEIGVILDTTISNTMIGYHFYYKDGSTVYPNRIKLTGIETIHNEGGSDVQVHIFNAPFEFALGWIQQKNLSGTITIHSYDTSPETDYVVATNSIVIRKHNPLEKEIDALPYGYAGYDEEEHWELKDLITKRDWVLSPPNWHTLDTAKIFQNVPEESILLKIGNEEMLLVYTKRNSAVGDTSTERPDTTFAYVLRGYNGVIEEHFKGDAVLLRKSSKTKIRYKYTRPMQGIKSLTPGDSWKFENIQDFLKGKKPLIVESSVPYKTELSPYVSLDFNLPDLGGSLLYVDFVTNAVFDMPYGSVSPAQSSINLAFNATKDWNTSSNKKAQRRFVGSRVGDIIVGDFDLEYKNFLAFKRILTGLPYYTHTIMGSVKHELIGYSINGLRGTGTTVGDNEFVTPWELSNCPNCSENLYIDSVKTLKETDIVVAFNTWLANNMQTKFYLDRPSLEIVGEVELKSAEIYAKIVPKKQMTTDVLSVIPIGQNAKICFGEKNGSVAQVFISDESYLGFSLGLLSLNAFTLYNLTNSEQCKKQGILSTRQTIVELDTNVSRIGSGVKIIGNEYYYEVDETEIRHKSNALKTYDEGVLFLEWNDIYLWVDNINHVLTVAKKTAFNLNPVEVIKNLLLDYSIDIDLSSFQIASSLRNLWRCSYVVKDEISMYSLIDLIAKNHGLIVSENNLGLISCTTLDVPVDIQGLREIGDSVIVYKKDLLDVKEDHTDLRYLVTKMDTYYEKVKNDGYKGLIKSDDLSYQDAMEYAKEILENDVALKLNLDSVIDKETADKSGVLKTHYHYTPTRVLELGCSLEIADIKNGEWVTCTSKHIGDVLNKIYLVIKTSVQVPINQKDFLVKIKLYEYDLHKIRLQIHEVPLESINTNYDEVISNTESIEEVPNGS